MDGKTTNRQESKAYFIQPDTVSTVESYADVKVEQPPSKRPAKRETATVKTRNFIETP
jgi:hypothetical protein